MKSAESKNKDTVIFVLFFIMLFAIVGSFTSPNSMYTELTELVD